MICVQGNGTAPVEGDKVPCKRAADDANVDGAGRGAVSKVGKGQIEKIDDEQHLCEPEVAADKEIDKSKE